MIRRLFFFVLTIATLLTACTDNDSFSTARGNHLTFSEDTIKFDTLFSTVPSATQAFWVHNNSSDGIRIRTARLERGSQSGYRANVDGTYLDPVGNDFEVRKGDSLLVFVEITAHENHVDGPQLVEDNLILTLESGEEQRVNLRTYSWDAEKITSLIVRRDTVIESSRPLVVYGNGICVEEGATLTLRNTELYFHDGAGIDVFGQFMAFDCLFRGDRLDRMFTYLPYDRIPGQWDGINIYPTSPSNQIANCEIRNVLNGLMCDSTEVLLQNTIIHNSNGPGLSARHSNVELSYCQLSNALDDCLSLDGCQALIDHCTLAQFYPFSANRLAAIHFTNTTKPLTLQCTNTLVTGYAEDVLIGEIVNQDVAFDYFFSDCILRTDSVNEPEHFNNIIWETSKSEVQGKQHFRTIDEENFYYDFTIDSISPAFSRHIGRIFPE